MSYDNVLRNTSTSQDLLLKFKSETSEEARQGYLQVIAVLNRAVPELMKESSVVNPQGLSSELTSVTISKGGLGVFILKSDQSFFNTALQRISRGSNTTKGNSAVSGGETKEKNAFEGTQNFSTIKPSFLRSISNSFFRGLSESTISNYPQMTKNIKAANMPILPSTYLAVLYFCTFFSVFIAAAAYGVLLFINLSLWNYFWIIPATPLIVFLGFLYYPKTEADTVKKQVSYELPFATIHMTAISGSNVEPSQIFEIIAATKEYPHIAREIQKVLVMVRVYGYDLVTALKNVASRTSNTKLSELLGGMATNISSGGDLKSYLEKKADNYLIDYRLERKRYIDVASTFMDIYISILIAAPMVLMLMFIIMNVSGIGFQGLSIAFLMFVSIIAIAIVNVIFLVIINLKQPKV